MKLALLALLPLAAAQVCTFTAIVMGYKRGLGWATGAPDNVATVTAASHAVRVQPLYYPTYMSMFVLSLCPSGVPYCKAKHSFLNARLGIPRDSECGRVLSNHYETVSNFCKHL